MTTLEETLQAVSLDPGFSSLGMADKMAYLQSEVLPKADPSFKDLSSQDQKTYIGQVILPAVKQYQSQPAFSGMFSKPQGPSVVEGVGNVANAAGKMLWSMPGDIGNAFMTEAKNQSPLQGIERYATFIPQAVEGLRNLAQSPADLSAAIGNAWEGRHAYDPGYTLPTTRDIQTPFGKTLGQIYDEHPVTGFVAENAVPVGELASPIAKLLRGIKGNPLRLISKDKIQGPRVRGLEDALMQEPAAYRTKKGLVTKEQKGLQQLSGMTQQRVNQAANATGLTKADAAANRRRAISKLYDDMTALSQHPQASPKQRAFAEKAAKAIKDRYERAQITKERAAIQEKYRAQVAASRVRKAVSDLTTDKVPVNERRAIREKFQQKAKEQNARERLLEKLNARKEAEAAKATAKTEAEAARQQRRIERQKELEAKANKSAQEKIELENLKQKNRLTLEEQKYRNRKALLEQKGQPAKPVKAQPAKPEPKPEAPQRETLYEGKATHNAQPVPKEDTLPGLNALQGHVEVQRRPELIKALDDAYRNNEFIKPKYNAEIVGQELDKLPGKGFVPYQMSAAKNGTVMIRVIDHEGQFRTIKLFDGKGGSALDSVKATGEKAPFQLASDAEDLTKAGTPRQRVLNADTGAIEPIYKSGEAIKTSELQVHEDVLRNARDVLARAEAGKATPREIVQASKAVTDQDIERALDRMTPEQRKNLLKEITGKDCQ